MKRWSFILHHRQIAQRASYLLMTLDSSLRPSEQVVGAVFLPSFYCPGSPAYVPLSQWQNKGQKTLGLLGGRWAGSNRLHDSWGMRTKADCCTRQEFMSLWYWIWIQGPGVCNLPRCCSHTCLLCTETGDNIKLQRQIHSQRTCLHTLTVYTQKHTHCW